ncbi:MAG: hypothetical protein IPN26_11720 [Bacteroidetes bacterium]|nr:hypothetical protein [Bacteroidota bacterium]
MTSPSSTNQWYYIVNTFDDASKQHKLYVDGILKSTNTFNSTIGYDNSKMYIGAAIENGGLAFPMDGELDDIKIYGNAMTASQILDVYKNEVAATQPGSGNGISLDGSNDYVQLPPVLDGATQFTVDFWIKTTENRSSATYWQKPSILGNGNPSGPDGDFGISTSNGFIGVWHGFCCGDQSFETTTAINDNKWHHVAAVNDGSNVILYVDGIQQAGSIPTGGGALQNAARPWRLGMIHSCCPGDTPHQGTLDEFRMWNIALTQTQIRDRMCRKITDNDVLYANLFEYLNFDEISGTTVFDGSTNGNTATLNNGATRVISGAPIGNTSSHDYSGASASVNLANPTRGDDLTVTLASGAAQGVQVYQVSEAPNNRTGAQGLETNDGYFGTFVIGGSSTTFNTVYNYDGIPNILDENGLSLFSRNDNSASAWTGELASINTTANTLTKNGISASQKEFIVGANDPGNISSNQSSCFAIVPSPLIGTAAFNGSPGVTYQWQDSIVGGTWQTISGATMVSPLMLPLASTPKYYRRLATSGSLTLSSNIVFLDILGAIAPNIIPNNQWNFYAYEGTSVDSIGLTYKGSYTQTTLGVNTTTDYGSGNNPSAASGYAGCAMSAPNNTYSLYAVRKGFPSGSYALNIAQHDDELKIFKDGVLLISAICCNNMGSQFFTLTTLDANSVIECRMTNSGGGPGQMVVDIFPQNLTGGTIGYNQSNCEAFTPGLLNNLHPAYGGSSLNMTYQWQESNDNINFNDISGATSLSYQPTLVSADKYFRRKVMNVNNEVGYSNVVFMDINGTTFYADIDGDGFGDPNNTVEACTAPIGYLSNNADCNDNDTLQKPGQIWYLDADDDGYKANNSTITQCSRPLNYKTFSELLSNQRDCNDNNNHIHPGAQYLTFTGANNFVNHICNPLLGDAFTNFRYEVMYFNIYNEMPENGAPRLSVDLGQDYVLDPGDKRVSMQQDDVNDTNTQDGKKYFLNVNGIQPGVALQSYVSPHLINCDFFGPFLDEPLVVNFPNLSIVAADITFSNYNPDVSTIISVTAKVKNPSSYAATNIPVRLINQFDTTQIFPIQTIAFIPSNGEAVISWDITTPSISALCPMKVVVDEGNTLSETNENDNTAIRGFVNGSGSVSGGIAVSSSVSPKTVLVGAGNAGNATLTGNAQYTGLALALNKAAVPGAEVSCTLIETGETFMGVTDANGNFSIPFTAPIGAGTYHFSGTVYDFTWAGYMNIDSNEFTVVPTTGQSDLQAILSIQSNSQMLPGQTIQAKYRSSNNGFIPSAGNHKCKLSIAGPGGFIFEDSTTISVLANGQSSPEISIQTGVLNNLGTYVLTVSTDTDDEEIESDESNNSVSQVIEVIPEQVDLIGENVQVAGGNTLCNSTQITVTGAIRNTGSIATTQGHQSLMRLKQGSTVLATQTFSVPVLQSNASASISHTFTVPYNLASYTLELVTDVNNNLPASLENKNTGLFIINIDTCKSDLIFADFCNNVSIEGPGNNYTGPVTLKNDYTKQRYTNHDPSCNSSIYF